MEQIRNPQLMHSVYFTLADRTVEGRFSFIEACVQYLSKHPGILNFSIGSLADDLHRDVNDRNFDVAMNILFESRAAHDDYQQSPTHEQFLAATEHLSGSRRVFDSYLS